MTVTVRFQNSTKRLIARFGKVRDIVRVSSEYDVDTQMYSETQVVSSVKMFKAAATKQEVDSPNLIGKEVYVFLIAYADLNERPKPNDKIIEVYGTEQEELRVQIVKEHWAGETPAAWRVICTKN